MKENDIRDLDRVRDFFAKEEEWLCSYADADGLIRPEFTEAVNCPCCSSGDSHLILIKNHFRFVECEECSTIFVNPRFTRKMIDEYYRTREARLDYQGVLTGGENQNNRILKIFRPRKRMIEAYLKRHGRDLRGCTFLDIGCASGQFLSVLAGHNSPVLYGVEASSDLAAAARGMVPEAKILDVPFEEVELDADSFNVVTLWEVLEHVFDPFSLLQKIVSILAGDGILVMSVPNMEGFDIQVLWDKGNAFSAPSHLNYFRKSSISILLERAGLVVEEISTPGLLDIDIVRNRMRNDPEIATRLGSFWDGLLSRKDAHVDRILDDLQRFIRRSGLSSHMVVISQKRQQPSYSCNQ